MLAIITRRPGLPGPRRWRSCKRRPISAWERRTSAAAAWVSPPSAWLRWTGNCHALMCACSSVRARALQRSDENTSRAAQRFL